MVLCAVRASRGLIAWVARQTAIEARSSPAHWSGGEPEQRPMDLSAPRGAHRGRGRRGAVRRHAGRGLGLPGRPRRLGRHAVPARVRARRGGTRRWRHLRPGPRLPDAEPAALHGRRDDRRDPVDPAGDRRNPAAGRRRARRNRAGCGTAGGRAWCPRPDPRRTSSAASFSPSCLLACSPHSARRWPTSPSCSSSPAS